MASLSSSSSSHKVLLEALTKYRVPLLCAALVFFYFGRLNYGKHVESVSALERAREGIMHIQTKCAGLRGGSACSPLVDRMLAYCAERINGGEEGGLKQPHGPFADGYDLHFVALAIRHGDRSAIHSMPGSLPYFDELAAPDESTKTNQNKEKNKKSGGWFGPPSVAKGHPVHGTDYLDTRALHYAPQLAAFEIQPLFASDGGENKGGAQQQTVLDGLRQNLEPTEVFQTPDTRLAPGLLTTRGFMQHVSLGQSLAKSYEALLGGVHSAQNIYVRSTNYARTVQSAAALVIGMLPDIGGTASYRDAVAAQGLALHDLTGQGQGLGLGEGQHPGKVRIETYLEEEAEVMHGVGLKLSSHSVDAKAGEKAILGSCDKSVRLAKQQKSAFVASPGVVAGLEALFDPPPLAVAGSGAQAGAAAPTGIIRNRFITDLADASIPHLCHNEELPCSSQGAGCLGETLLGQLMRQADRAFCDRYTGSAGGRDATRISIYPFLHEVLASLRAQAQAYGSAPLAAAGSGSGPGSGSGSGSGLGSDLGEGALGGSQRVQPTEQQIAEARRVKLHIYSGHDTVIAPVLAALGAFEGRDCVWPPYASRIAFELWRPRPKGQQPSAAAKGAASAAAAAATGGADAPKAVPEADWGVRVVFNGRDITALVPACAREASQRGNKSTRRSSMCSLAALSAQVEGLLGEAKSLQEACSA